MATTSKFNQLSAQIEIIDEQSRERTRTINYSKELNVVEEAFRNTEQAITLGGSSNITSPRNETELINERDFNIKIFFNKKKKQKVKIHNLPSILQTNREQKQRNSSLQSYLFKGSTDLSYQQKTERPRVHSKMDIIGLETEICHLINNSDIEASVQAFKQVERNNFESLFEQKMLNMQMKIKSQFDSTSHRLRTQQILQEARRRKEQETSRLAVQELPADVYAQQIQDQKQNILRMLGKNSQSLTNANYDPQLQMFPNKSQKSFKLKMSGDSSGLIPEVSDESHLQSISHVKASQKSIQAQSYINSTQNIQSSQHDSSRNFNLGGSIIAESMTFPAYMTVQEPRKKISTNTFSPYSIAMQLPPPPKLPKGAHERMLFRIKQPLLPITQKSKQFEEELLKTLSDRSNRKKKHHFDSLPAQMHPKELFTNF